MWGQFRWPWRDLPAARKRETHVVLSTEREKKMVPSGTADAAMVCCGLQIGPTVHARGCVTFARWECPGCGEACQQQVGLIDPRRARRADR